MPGHGAKQPDKIIVLAVVLVLVIENKESRTKNEDDYARREAAK